MQPTVRRLLLVWIAVGLALQLGGGAWLWLWPPSTRAFDARSCDFPVVVQTALYCDADDLLRALAPAQLLDGPSCWPAPRETSPDLDTSLVEFHAGDSMSAEELAIWQLPIFWHRTDAGELQSLRGVGPVMAEKLAATRDAGHQDFDALETLRGIGPKKLAAWRSRLIFGDYLLRIRVADQ